MCCSYIAQLVTGISIAYIGFGSSKNKAQSATNLACSGPSLLNYLMLQLIMYYMCSLASLQTLEEGIHLFLEKVLGSSHDVPYIYW